MEIIDVENSTFNCNKVSSILVSLHGSTGGLIEGKTPFFCGGKYGVDNKLSRDCFALNETGSSTWTKDQKAYLTKERMHAGYGSVIVGNELVLTGGIAQPDFSAHFKSIELVSPYAAGSKTLSVELPTGMRYHCNVLWDSDTFMLIGGYSGGNRPETYFINIKTNQLTEGPILKEARSCHACGEIKGSGTFFIVVSGGWDYSASGFMGSMEILDKSNVEQGWMKGNTNIYLTINRKTVVLHIFLLGENLPGTKAHFQMISLHDKEHLYTIGGEGSHKKEVFKLTCGSGSNTCKWTKIDTELKYERSRFIAMAIPESLAEKLCS